MFLITGASGQVGLALIKALASQDISIRAWIHHSENRDLVLQAGAAEVFVGDLNSEADQRKAIAGVDTIYYICNTANPKEAQIGKNLISLAKKSDNITFIYHSVLHSLLQEMPHHDQKRQVEQYLVDSGIPYFIIQPTVFMQMFNPAIQSVLHGGPLLQKFYTSSQTKMSFVDLNDYAQAATKMIISKTFDYGTYELSSRGTYSLTDVEDIFSKIMGKKIRSQFISDSQFLKLSHLKLDSYMATTLLKMFNHYNTSSFCGNSFTLTNILNRKPTSLEEFLVNNLSY